MIVDCGLAVAIALAIVLLVKGLYPADLPESQSPDFVDNIFDNRGVLWAARLLLVSAAGVLAFGGVFIWRQVARSKEEEVADLRERLERSEILIGELRELR
jgi:hypothetical protein